MINDFDDFCLWMYVVVDDICEELAFLFKRPGPAPECSDREAADCIEHGETTSSRWFVFLSVDFLRPHQLSMDYRARLPSALPEAKIHKVLMK